MGHEMNPPGTNPPYRSLSIGLSNIDPESIHYDPALVAKLRELRTHFTPDSVVRLWTCNAIKGDDGEKFMQLFANLLGVKVQGLDTDTYNAIVYFWEPRWFEATPYPSCRVGSAK